MNFTSLLPVIAALLFLLFAASLIFNAGQRVKHSWRFPALLCLLFVLVSLKAVVAGGALGFWVEHTRNEWGNQIWFDLLFGIGIGWYLIVPQAKAHEMRLLPWLALIVCTGSVGFLAMLARLLYLQEQARSV